MSFYNVITALLVFTFATNNDVKAQTWVSLDGSNQGKNFTSEILESDVSIHKVKMTLHGFNDRKIIKDSIEYHQIFMDEYTGLMNYGEPQLPTISQLIAIPEGSSYKVSLIEEKWQDVGIGTIFPAQRDVKGNQPESEFMVHDSIYQQNIYSPALVQTGNEQNWRSIRNVSIQICPFRYYPLQNRLSVLTEFVLQVDFMGAADISPVKSDDIREAIKWHMFDNDIRDFPVRTNMDKANSSSNDYDYLIILGDIPYVLNCSALNDFRKWKAYKGFKSKVVSTTTIGSTPDSIKSYIANELNNGVKYVLFIGDNDKIPTKVISDIVNNDTVKSDYWYGCINDVANYHADIPIGRFSIDGLSSFQKMVEKTIAYENSYDGNYRKTLLVAHKEDAPYKYQGCSETIRNAYYTTPLTFTTAYGASTYNNGNDATNTDVVNYINSGMHIINYRGHGITDSWGFPSNISSRNGWNTTNQLFQANQINNISKCAIYFNSCCQTGNIEQEPCMMETFTRSSVGAIACLAATEDTWTVPNHTYDQNLFKKLLNDGVWHIGDLNMQAHIATIGANNNEAEYNALSYVCLGDPALEIWTGTPATFSDISVMKSGNNVIVSSPTLTSGDIISVVSHNGDLIHKIDLSGCSGSFPMPLNNFYIAVNKHNYYPYIKHFKVIDYIQNVEFYEDDNYIYTPLQIGYDVTQLNDYGNVVVKNGAKLTIYNGTGGVTIKNGFECENGAELIIE